MPLRRPNKLSAVPLRRIRSDSQFLLDRRAADRQVQNVDFNGRTKMFVSLFQIRRQHIFDPFHERADPARQIASMCYDEGHGERPTTKIGYDLHKRSTL
jgi:hypothetical protein